MTTVSENTHVHPHFFIGVVEDVNDPLQANRVRVRAIGFHPEMADGGIPTDDLPWALVGLPTTASGMSGVGSTHGLKDGSWVFGYFIDGADAQYPVVLNSFAGAPGFSPLQKEYMKSGLAISGSGPGGLAGAFQTIRGNVLEGLGAASKYGAVIGSALSIANLIKNDGALQALMQLTSNAIQRNSGLQNVMDSAQADIIKNSTTLANLPFGRFASILPIPNAVLEIFKAGGAKGPSTDSVLGGTQFGNMSDSDKPAPEDLTVTVQTDYDKLVEDAPDDLVAVTIHSTNTSKLDRYTLLRLSKEGSNEYAGFHFMVDQTGQIIKVKDSKDTGSHTKGFNTLTTEFGGTGNNWGIALVGGKNDGKGTLDSMYHVVQLQVLEKFLAAIIRRFPKIVITGANELTSTSSPGFNVSEWGSTLFSNNVNTTKDGRKVPGDGTETTLAPNKVGSVETVGGSGDGSGYNDDTERTPTGNKRGFQGGPHHPDPKYASRRASDVPAMARINSYTNGIAAGGSPEKMYLGKIQEPNQYSFPTARPADTLESRSVPKEWSVPKFKHGGEYIQANVVRSTEGGHHILLDDTSGNQKLELMHSSGSLFQIHADGSGLLYIKKDGYEVIVGDKYVGISGGMNIAIGGDMKVSVKGDLVYDVTGDVKFNVAGDMHDLIKGDKSSVIEGSDAKLVKKGSTERIAKDKDVSVGGKSSESIEGSKSEDVRGNKSSVVRGESSEFVGGNKAAMIKGVSASHAMALINQAVGEMVSVAGGNSIMSAKSKVTVVSGGETLISSGAASKIVSTGKTTIQAGGALDLRASGAINADGSSINLNSGTSSAVSGTTPSDVEASKDLTPESNISNSQSNLGAEQPVTGEIDRLEAMDSTGETGSEPPGSLGTGGSNASSGGGAGGDFNAGDSGSQVSAGSLGSSKADACSIAQKLVDKGWSQHGAAALVGNMQIESSFNPNALNPNDSNGLPSGGLVQWNGARFANLKSFAAANGMEWNTTDAQVAFIDYESRNSEASAGSKMINASTMLDAIKGAAAYERFQGYNNGYLTGGAWENKNGNRASQGLAVYNECFGGTEQSVGGQPAGELEGYSGGGGSSGGGAGGGGGDGSQEGSQGAAESVPGSGDPRPPAVNENEASGPINWGMKVSPHYTLGQMCPTSRFRQGMNAHGAGSISHSELILNLSAVAMNVMERLHQHYGRAVVMSGYRSKAYNDGLRRKGGKPARNSDHLRGQAADIKVSGVSPREVANWVENNIKGIAGIGRYPTFTHVSWYREGNGGRIRRWGRN